MRYRSSIKGEGRSSGSTQSRPAAQCPPAALWDRGRIQRQLWGMELQMHPQASLALQWRSKKDASSPLWNRRENRRHRTFSRELRGESSGPSGRSPSTARTMDQRSEWLLCKFDPPLLLGCITPTQQRYKFSLKITFNDELWAFNKPRPQSCYYCTMGCFMTVICL